MICPPPLTLMNREIWLQEVLDNAEKRFAKYRMKKNPHAVALGRKGGKAGTGKAKARTSEQARAAVNARWEKRRAEK